MTDNYPSPKWLSSLFEGFYDPCPLNGEGMRSTDGLGDWKDKNFVNPPYSEKDKWIDKAIEEHKKGKTVILLLPCDPSTKWFMKLIGARAHIFFSFGRIQFSEGGHHKYPSMLAILA